MKKIFLVTFLLLSYANANYFEVNLESENQKSNDFLFIEALSDANITGLEKLSKSSNNINLNFQGNFNDMIGVNYTKSLSGITYDNKEIYFGTRDMKYLGISKIQKDIKYTNRDTKKTIDKYTIFNIFEITKENLSTNGIENMDAAKAVFYDDINATQDLQVTRKYNLETFSITSENLYDMVRDDLKKGKEYLNPIMYSKKVNSNLSLYGVAIISFVQHNYREVNNYYTTNDVNKTTKNISYGIEIEDGITKLKKAEDSNFFLYGRYDGYEYGYKLSALYELKKYSLFLTAYSKKTSLKNKAGQEGVEEKAGLSVPHNALFYQKLSSTKQYIKFGIKYIF